MWQGCFTCKPLVSEVSLLVFQIIGLALLGCLAVSSLCKKVTSLKIIIISTSEKLKQFSWLDKPLDMMIHT